MTREELNQKCKAFRQELLAKRHITGLPNQMRKNDWLDFRHCWEKYSTVQKRHYLAAALGTILLNNPEADVELINKFRQCVNLEDYTDTEKKLIAQVVRDNRRFSVIAEQIACSVKGFAEKLFQPD